MIGAQVFTALTFLFCCALAIVALLIPFFILKIRNQVVELNERAGRMLFILEKEVKRGIKG